MKLFSFLFLSVITVSCVSGQQTTVTGNTRLKFIGEYDVPYNKLFQNTVIGGLSGIDHDKKMDLYYLISDDRSSFNPARFYTAKIYATEKGIDSVQFISVTNMRQPNGTFYPNSQHDPAHTPDPEAMRYNPKKNELTWSSEGERIVRKGMVVLEDPVIINISKNGMYKDSFQLPFNMHMHPTENGPRQNGVFEGLTFANDFKTLYVNVEEPIYEDGPRAGLNDSTGWIRILKFNVATRRPVAQYAYKIEPVAYFANPPGAFKINGVPDILWLGENKLLVIERSFSIGRNSCTIRVFLADLGKATNVETITSLRTNKNFIPASKKLLLNMDSLGIYIDNIEGVTFGPVLPNGHKTLVFVADNNFSPLEKTQFLLFEIE